MFKEFKEFALKGNVIDLAVGVIIGAAFGRIVTSIVEDIFMPAVGKITGGLDFTNKFVPLSDSVTAANLADAKKQGAVLAWGNFITVTINFLIIALILFLVIKAFNKMRRRFEKEEGVKAAEVPAEVKLLTEIRDLLGKRAP
ncbi:MAG: large conductance mechanosensitive channel protein MscL [Verrucomicrobiales bacterium]